MTIFELRQYTKEFKATYPEYATVFSDILSDTIDEILEEGVDESHTCELAHQSMKDVVTEIKNK